MIVIIVYYRRCLFSFNGVYPTLLVIVPRIPSLPSRYGFLCAAVYPLVILSLMALRSKLSFFFLKQSLFYPHYYFTISIFTIK